MDNFNKTLFLCHETFRINNSYFLQNNNIKVINIDTTKSWQLDEYIDMECSKNSYTSISIILTDSFFEDIEKNGLLFSKKNQDVHKVNFDTTENWKKFTQTFKPNVKIIFIDDAPESGNTEKNILHFLNVSDNCYVISSRYMHVKHDRLFNDMVYLPMIYSFYHLKFSRFPKLDYSFPSNPKYDFITYLGQTYKVEKINQRLNFLKYILNDDLSKLKYKDYNDITISEKNMGPKENGHMWNLLNSLSAKIQLIFENSLYFMVEDPNYYPDTDRQNEHFLTEKTMKLFLLPHPYVVFLNDFVLNSLKRYGFKFSYDGTDYKTLLNTIKEDIDDWVTKNESDFYHNYNLFHDMVVSSELEHHLILKKIINNEV